MIKKENSMKKTLLVLLLGLFAIVIDVSARNCNRGRNGRCDVAESDGNDEG